MQGMNNPHFTMRCVTIGADFARDMREAQRVAVDMELNGGIGRQRLVLLIDSGGGDHMAMAEAIAFFRRHSQIELATVVTGECSSAAVAVCAAGNKDFRLALRGTRFMVHPMRIEVSYSGSFLTYQTRTKSYMEADWRQQEAYIEMLAECSKKPTSFWRERIFGPHADTQPDGEFETVFTAEQALVWGCVDHVCDGMDEVMHYLRNE